MKLCTIFVRLLSNRKATPHHGLPDRCYGQKYINAVATNEMQEMCIIAVCFSNTGNGGYTQ